MLYQKGFVDKEGNPIPWEIRVIDEDLNESIRESCKVRKETRKTRVVTERTNYELYLAKLAVECVWYIQI